MPASPIDEDDEPGIVPMPSIRSLRFMDAQAEADFLREVDAQSRRPFTVMLCITLVMQIACFGASNTPFLFTEDYAVAKVLVCSRLGSFLCTGLFLVLARLGRSNCGDLGLAWAILLSFLRFLSSPHRMAQVLSARTEWHESLDCDRVVCDDDANLLLDQTCLCHATLIFVVVRSSRSWLLPFSQAAFYGLFSLTGIGPLGVPSHARALGVFVVQSFLVWHGCHTRELHVRKSWRLAWELRMEIKAQKALNDEARMEDIMRRVEAMHAVVHGAPCTGGTGKWLSGERSLETDAAEDLKLPAPRFQVFVPEGAEDAPNSLLVAALKGQRGQLELVQSIAERILDVDYGMRAFYEDIMAAFPELRLQGDLQQVSKDGQVRPGPWLAHASSGRGRNEEFQRTMGALFAVYWLLRLDLDGKHGFCFGVDQAWAIRTGVHDSLEDLDDAAAEDARKRRQFFEQADWAKVKEVVSMAVGTSRERIMAILCLTAFHDIMKLPEFCPVVAKAHAPYQGYPEGSTIGDHDIALAYVLEHYPDVLPSYRMLPGPLREVVLFTQNKMQFNHGWFVQAEAPPGAMLSTLKRVLARARHGDLAFYFLHWLTDLSAAEGTPLGGAEKFVLKFPRAVLEAFLWSIPYLQHLQEENETTVVENYLLSRWQHMLPSWGPPEGESCVARLRLALMAQTEVALALEAFDNLSPVCRRVLSEEMARTGIAGQSFRGCPVQGGPALLVYYGPALLQRCRSVDEMLQALQALVALYSAGRALWPIVPGGEDSTVTLHAGHFNAHKVSHIAQASPDEERSAWVVIRKNVRDAEVRLVPVGEVNSMSADGTKFWVLDTRRPIEVPKSGVAEGRTPELSAARPLIMVAL